jgi:hypothetical protein
VPLVEGYADIMILAVSPNHDYLALAVTQAGKLGYSSTYPRFVESDAESLEGKNSPVSLLVVPVDRPNATLAYSDATRINAIFPSAEKLLVTVLEGTEVIYFIGPADGSQLQKLAISSNRFITPTPVPTVTVTVTP